MLWRIKAVKGIGNVRQDAGSQESKVKFGYGCEINIGVKNDLGRGNCKCGGSSSVEKNKGQHG